MLHYAIVGRSPVDSLSRVLHDSQPKLSETFKGRYSPAFLSAIDKALSVKPADRFASANEFRDALGVEKRATGPTTVSKIPVATSVEHLVAEEFNSTVIVNSPPAKTKPNRKVALLIACAAVITLAVAGWNYLAPAPESAKPVLNAKVVETITQPLALPKPEVLPEPVIKTPVQKLKTEDTKKIAPFKSEEAQKVKPPVPAEPAASIVPNETLANASTTASTKPLPSTTKKAPKPVTSASDSNNPPVLAEGSFWKYQRSDSWLNEIPRKTSEETRVLSVEPNGYRVMLKSGGLGERERVFNKDGNQTYRVDGTPHVNQTYIWPMVIGKTWSINRIYTSTKTSLKVAVQEQCKVAQGDDVTVPAGQFKALRIDCQGFETPQGQSALRTETSHWYAPEVQRFAKTAIKKWTDSTLTTSEILVLTQYSLK